MTCCPGEDVDYQQNDGKQPELAECCAAEIWLGRKSEGSGCKQHEQKQWCRNWRKPEPAPRDEPLNGKCEDGAGQKYYAKAMPTSGIVTPSIVNQRAATRSLIARDCMREVNPNCDGLMGGGALECLTAVSIFEPKDYSRSRCC